MSEKIDQLMTWTNARPVIRLNADKFRQYVRSGPKNYSIVVLLNALSSKHKCSFCKEANDEFSIVANSWRYGPTHTNNLFFATVDFDESPDVFQMLNQNSVPMFIHFPSKGGNKKADVMDIQRSGVSANSIARFVEERTGAKIRLFRPPDYASKFILMMLGLSVFAFIYIKRDCLEYLNNTTMWCVMVLVIIFAMFSGQMWNQIRGPALMHRNPETGEIGFFSGHSQYQFITESYIIFVLYAITSCGIIVMNEASKMSDADGSHRKILSLAGAVAFAFFFSVLLSIFRAKYQGYPYSFLFS